MIDGEPFDVSSMKFISFYKFLDCQCKRMGKKLCPF